MLKHIKRQPATTVSKGPYQDPNPALLFSVFTSILTNIAAVLSRGEQSELYRTDDLIGLRRLLEYVEEAIHLQVQHHKLIAKSSAQDKTMYPIGTETLWLTQEQAKEYLQIRDRTIEMFSRVARESSSINTVPRLTYDEKECFDASLQVIRLSIYATFRASSFGEAADILNQDFRLNLAHGTMRP